MKSHLEILEWLLQGDVSVQYQANRDLLGNDDETLQQRIAAEGWGAQFLSNRKPKMDAKKSAIEFLLCHQLFLSDRTGKIIHKDFLKLSYPSRWKYDILRALDYLQYAKVPWDLRMQAAMDVLYTKRNKEGTWNVQARHPGKIILKWKKRANPVGGIR